MGDDRKRFAPNGGVDSIGSSADVDRPREHNFAAERERFLRTRTETLRAEFAGRLDEELNRLLADLFDNDVSFETPENLQNGVSLNSRPPSVLEKATLPTFRVENKSAGQIQRKEFVARNSLLTDLFEISHLQTLQYVFVALLIVFGINTIVTDLFSHGTIAVDFHVWVWSFGQFPLVVTIWLTMQSAALLAVYYPLVYWAANRPKVHQSSLFDRTFVGFYCLYLTAFALLPFFAVVHNDLPTASSAIVIFEQVRFIMKSHSFVREKVGEILALHQLGKTVPTPRLSNYLYFQFVPTLIYRDEYPRTKTIRWNYVVAHFATFLGGVLYTYYVFVRISGPGFRNFNQFSLQEYVNVETFVKSIFSCILPGTLELLAMFYSFLHGWSNAFAELTRFADRMFYRDWWNVTTFSGYYRNWNVVCHDWLYTYVYSDIYQLGSKYRHLALFATMILSATVHEYIVVGVLRMFYPVMFVLFGVFGVGMSYLTQGRRSRPWNVHFWCSLLFGQGVFLCLYSSEYYARRNCPPTSDNYFMDLIIPRSWNCFTVRTNLETVVRESI